MHDRETCERCNRGLSCERLIAQNCKDLGVSLRLPQPPQTGAWACYTAKSGRLYYDGDHSGCLFAARDAGEPEAQGFPECGDNFDLDDLESRMGFLVRGEVLTRAEADARYDFELAEDIPLYLSGDGTYEDRHPSASRLKEYHAAN